MIDRMLPRFTIAFLGVCSVTTLAVAAALATFFIDVLPLSASLNGLAAYVGTAVLMNQKTRRWRSMLLGVCAVVVIWVTMRYVTAAVGLLPYSVIMPGKAVILMLPIAVISAVIHQFLSGYRAPLWKIFSFFVFLIAIPVAFGEPLSIFPYAYTNVTQTPELLAISRRPERYILASLDRSELAIMNKFGLTRVPLSNTDCVYVGGRISTNSALLVRACRSRGDNSITLELLREESGVWEVEDFEHTVLPASVLAIGRNALSPSGEWVAFDGNYLCSLRDIQCDCRVLENMRGLFTGWQVDSANWSADRELMGIRIAGEDVTQTTLQVPATQSGTILIPSPSSQYLCSVTSGEREISILSVFEAVESPSNYTPRLFARDMIYVEWLSDEDLLVITQEHALCRINVKNETIYLLSRLAEVVISFCFNDTAIYYTSSFDDRVVLNRILRY